MRRITQSSTQYIDMPAHLPLFLEQGRDGGFVAFHQGRTVILNGMPNEREANMFGIKLEAGCIVFVKSELITNPRGTVWFAELVHLQPEGWNELYDVPAILPASIADRASCPGLACLLFNGEGLNSITASYMVWKKAEAVKSAAEAVACEERHNLWLAKREVEEAPARAAAAAARAAVVAIHGEATAAFADSLKSFDSFYGYSDDIRVWKAGKETETALLAVKATLTREQAQAAFSLAGKEV